MKKIMISQPMTGKSEEEIQRVRKEAIAVLEKKYPGCKIVNTRRKISLVDKLFHKRSKNIDVKLLATALDMMAECDIVYLCKGWYASRGCNLELEVALAYGLTVIEGSECSEYNTTKEIEE